MTSTNQAPKPTIADAQKLVQTISSDKTKLQAYREIGKLQDQMEKAEEKNDTKTIEALGAKVDNLEQQVGPDYARIMDGLSRPIRILLRDRSLPMYSILSTRNANTGSCAAGAADFLGQPHARKSRYPHFSDDDVFRRPSDQTSAFIDEWHRPNLRRRRSYEFASADLHGCGALGGGARNTPIVAFVKLLRCRKCGFEVCSQLRSASLYRISC